MPRLWASLIPLFLLVGCDSPTRPDAGSLPFSTLAAAEVAGSGGPQLRAVVRDPRTWSGVWSTLWGGREPALPPVDFAHAMVVVVTGSETCFGGAEVEEILVTPSGLEVRYADASPSLCLCAQAALSFHAVRAPTAPGEAVFVARRTPPLCPA